MNAPLDPAKPRTEVVAFLAAGSGSGRTSGVANVAWLLGAAGRRVLVVDWSAEATSVHEYLRPYHIGTADAGEALIRAYTTLMTGAEGKPYTVERHEMPGGRGRVDVVGVPDGNGGLPTTPRALGMRAYLEIREQLRTSGYDHVLIDAPPGTDETLARSVAALCDTTVMCFRSSHQAIQDSATLAKMIRTLAPTHLAIVPVVTMFDRRYPLKADQSQKAIQDAFGTMLAEPRLGTTTTPRIVEIPYYPYGVMFDPMIAVLAEDPDQPLVLTEAYQQLADEVAGGNPIRPTPVPDVIRARYRRGFGLSTQEAADRIGIAYAPEVRLWAEWLRDRLIGAGVEVTALRSGHEWIADENPPELVVVTGGETNAKPFGRAVRALRGREHPADVVQLLPPGHSVELPRVTAVIAVDALGEEVAVKRLLAHFGLIRQEVVVPPRSRFPADGPTLVGRPQRPAMLIGRDKDVENLRDTLLEQGSGRGAPLTISGMRGVGKSALVAEYAYRFAADYDVVWWIPAHDRQSVLASLTDLAGNLHKRELGRTAAQNALDIDTTGTRFDRWLLIYDDVDPEAVADLLPTSGAGHTLMTTTVATAPGIELRPPPDASLIVKWFAPQLDTEDTLRIAAAVDGLPLAAEVAGRWLAEHVRRRKALGAAESEAVREAVEHFLATTDEGDAGAGAVNRVVHFVLETLMSTSNGRMAIRLAELCSFLSPTGVDLRLLRIRALTNQLVADGNPDGDALRKDSLELDRILWNGTRCGLFQVDWSARPVLRMHRSVQLRLRALMTDGEPARRRAQALVCLAAYAPNEDNEKLPDRHGRFRELERHIGSSGALDSDNDGVRRWLVNQARFYYTDGHAAAWRAVRPQIAALVEQWEARFDRETDTLWARLVNQLANLHRALGQHQVALELDMAVLRVQRRSLSVTHPRTLVTARGRAADLRGLGHFADALTEDDTTFRRFRDELGADHPSTRNAANNFALAMYLAGDQVKALEYEEGNHRRLLRLVGADDTMTWWSLCNIGQYAREIGDYDKALTALRTALDGVRGAPVPNNHLELRIVWYHAITLRRMGRLRQARDRTSRALRGHQEARGVDHPITVACQLSLAADERRSNPTRSVELVQDCLRVYTRSLNFKESHPFVALCRTALGQSLRAARRFDDAVTAAEAGWRALDDRLSSAHPWTLAAAIDHCAALAAAGDVAAAAVKAHKTYEQCLDNLSGDHPCTEAARVNALEASGGRTGWRDIDVDIPQT